MMSYVPTRPDSAGNLPMSRSIVSGAPASVRPGEVAINAADGVMYVGLNSGLASTLPSAVGFNRIETMTQSAYDALSPKVATTLYIVTPT